MAYRPVPQDYDEDDLRRIAQKLFFEREKYSSFKEIGEALSIHPRAKVEAMCEAVYKADFLHICIAPDRLTDPEELRDLGAAVRDKYNLKDAIVVPGRGQMAEGMLPDSAREAIMDDVIRSTVRQVENVFLSSEVRPIMAVSYGYVTRKVADQMRPDRVRSDGLVVAAQGARQKQIDRFDANTIVRDIAKRLGCKYSCLSIPALIDKNLEDHVLRLGLVKDVLAELRHANLVLGSLASVHQRDSLQNELILEDEMRYVRENGALGNFGGWWFRRDGSNVDYRSRSVVGLGLDHMRKLVADKQPVVLAVGADPSRIPALAVALNPYLSPIGNIWIGDEVTARVLLGQQKLDVSMRFHSLDHRSGERFNKDEIQILRELFEKKGPALPTV